MNEQQLNKKLLKWAGFKEVYGRYYGMNDPNGAYVSIPNFLNSLDVCFKWLWELAVDRMAEVFKVERESAIRFMFDWWQEELQKHPKEHAVALCLAIEKLIDVESK